MEQNPRGGDRGLCVIFKQEESTNLQEEGVGPSAGPDVSGAPGFQGFLGHQSDVPIPSVGVPLLPNQDSDLDVADVVG